MKKYILIFMISCLLIGCTSEVKTFKLVTGGTGGTYYPLGSAMAELLTDKNDDFNVNAYTGNASVQNSQMILNHEIDMALVQSNVAYWAVNGDDMFNEPVENMRGIAVLYPEFIQILTRKDAGIETLEDLRGKNVSLGKENSGNYFDAMNILDAYGLKSYDFIKVNFQFKDSVKPFIEGDLDAIFVTSGIPTESIIQIASNVEITLIEIDAKEIVLRFSEQPYYSDGIIPANTYRGIDTDIASLMTSALWVCDASLDEDIVYEMTKTFWENYESLLEVTPNAKWLSLDHALDGMSIDLHPGAQKYYEEKNIETK